MIRLIVLLSVFCITDIAFSMSEKPASTNELTVYSARKEHLVKPLFEAYEKQTGVKIKYITDKAGALLTKLQAEGKNSPADMLITVDAGNLWQAANSNLLEPVNSEKLSANIPSHLRSPDNTWFGLSIRARTIAYNPKKVKKSELSTYEALSEKSWKGRVCLRTSKKVYNQSLVAMFMQQYGEKRTEEIVSGWVNNLAAPVFSNDTAVLEAIAAGQCDVGIVNTYYFGRLMKKNPKLNLALFWPNQNVKAKNNRGVHVNISGAGIVKTSKNKMASQKFLEWLSSKEAQAKFAQINLEYPVHPKTGNDPLVDSWGKFDPSLINVSFAGKNQAKAIRLMDRSKYK